MSKASELAQGIAQVLAGITKLNGYQTDIGLRVYRGRVTTTLSSVPFVVLKEGQDSVKASRPQEVVIRQPYVIEGVSEGAIDNPNDVGHQMLADIKKALFSGPLEKGSKSRFGTVECELEYKGRFIAQREEGSAIVTTTVAIECMYPEDLTKP